MWHGKAGKLGRGSSRYGGVWQGRQGMAGHVALWLGMAGMARTGRVGLDKAGKPGHGGAQQGVVMQAFFNRRKT